MHPQDFYGSLAENYHLIFEDWEASMARQSNALSPLLTSLNAKNVLDCACGIGTQSLGLAQRGFQMTGTDISAPAVERARREAGIRGLQIEFNTANILDLPPAQFDAVICLDNALPHFETQSELIQAATQIRACLKPGGHFIASIRDYDQLILLRPVVQGPSFYPNRIVHQIWEWQDDRRYILHLYITLNTECHHYTTTYRALLRAELDEALLAAGFAQPEWRMPEATGFYQPIVIC
jgi:glycine/sarcosine N-methyltransferase